VASNHGAVAAALLLGAGLAMAPGVSPGVAEHLDYDTGTWDPWAPWP